MSTNRGHRAGQCAPEVPRTGIRARGDLQEGNGCASRCLFTLFSSTKSGFLCFFGLRNPHFRVFRAQNRGFCAFLGFETPVFRRFEHKIAVFVRFWLPEPPFSGVSSTKSGFLCALSREGGVCRHGNLIADPPVWVRPGILVGSSCGWRLRLCGLRP